MKKNTAFLRPLLFSFLLITFITSAIFIACSKSVAPAAKVVSVQVMTNATLGNYLTDSKGNTLYFFTLDIAAPSCTGGCLLEWPAFYDSLISATTLGAGLNASDFGMIVAGNGQKQTTYKGWPLYYFAPPNGSGINVPEPSGQTMGDKVGNVWFVVSPAYSILCGNKKVVNVTVKDTIQKQFLVDSAGNTLYYWKKDSLNPTTLPTNCTGGCIAAWPVYYTSNPVVPSLLNKSDFGTITRNDGPNNTTRMQSTYKGRPLYYFASDSTRRGVVKGEGVGSVWFSVNPDVPPL
jgi:predicted lipoprotein with Yx(FWY)xxD motif